MITIAVSIVVIVLALLGWNYYRNHKASFTADSLIADFTGVVSKLEAYAEGKVTQVEDYIYQSLHIDQLKADAAAEAQKAKDYAAKIKGLFS